MGDLQRQIGERAQAAAEPTLLDLVRQYALSLVRSSGLPTGESLRLWESIAALVPTLPVQARDANGMLWWIHGCGEVNGWAEGDRPGPFSCGTLGCTAPWRPLLVGGEPRPEPVQARDGFGTIWQHSCGMTGYGSGGSCPGNCGEDGPWRPLLVAPDAAPDGDRAPDTGCEVGADGVTCIVADRAHRDAQHSGSTLWDVATLLNDEGDNWLDNPGERREQRNAPECICPDDRDHNSHRLSTMREQRMQELAAAEITLREVMAALGVDRPEHALGAIAADRELITEVLRQRDEARAELVKVSAELKRQRDAARAEIERLHDECAGLLRVLDMVRRAVYDHLPSHDAGNLILSLVNGPADATTPIVLRLPELPPGTVALIGKLTGNPYVMHGGRWCFGPSAWTYSELLGHEGEVTVELAPEPEPQQPRTAAEVWRGMQRGDNARLMTSTLAEALDREVAAEAQRRYVAERGAR